MAAANSTAPTLTSQQIERFWSKVTKTSPSECWPWTGYILRRRNGPQHGYFWAGHRQPIGAHVVARYIVTGEWPAGVMTLHTCDNPPCCNPAHLYLGTHRDNTRDMLSRKRDRATIRPETYDLHRGERSGQAKLTDAQVLEIRRLHAAGTHKNAELGRLFGVSKVLIGYIVKRRIWRHIPEVFTPRALPSEQG